MSWPNDNRASNISDGKSDPRSTTMPIWKGSRKTLAPIAAYVPAMGNSVIRSPSSKQLSCRTDLLPQSRRIYIFNDR